MARKSKTASAKKKPKVKTTIPKAAKKPAGKKRQLTVSDSEIDKMTARELKELCEEQGLHSKGKKAELIKRLKEVEEEESEPPTKVAKLKKQNTMEKAAAALIATGTGKKKTFKPDKQCTLANRTDCQVYKDYDVMLNKTDIKANNNKYYIIQVLTAGGNFYAWNRWGRVGDPPGCFHGQKLHGPFKSAEPAMKSFDGKFWDKSRTRWEDRAKYKPVKGKYTLIEMGEEDEEEPVKISMAEGKLAVTAPCKLDSQTQGLIRFIFDTDMFKKAMVQLSFDVKKMPLGKLSKVQIAKGFQVLSQIRDAINKNQRSKLNDLSSSFYTVIPHDFGWKRPSVIGTNDEVREKMDNLLVLGDIELAQALQKNQDKIKKQIKADDLPPHPLDVSYGLLDCDLDIIPENSKEFKTIQNYMNATRGYAVKKLKNVWQMSRRAEAEGFKRHDKVNNRRLLWHGTNVAVCAAILKEGLRIMPHSGGRVGRGLYFASENSKSAAYVRSVDKIGVMFLNEVVLGKEKSITVDDSSLIKAPAGFDSIVARGRTEPNPKQNVTLSLDGKKVVVPQGIPVQQPQYAKSNFTQSEYLIYKEDQVRMRYLCQMEWTY